MTGPGDVSQSHSAAQLGRAVRLFVFALGSAAVATPMAQQWEVRYPLLGALVAALEVTWREVFPVRPVPDASAVLAPPSEKPPTSPGGGGGR